MFISLFNNICLATGLATAGSGANPNAAAAAAAHWLGEEESFSRKMAEGATSLKGLREQMVAAAQAIAEERRSQSGSSPLPAQLPINIKSATKPVIDGSTLRTDERQRLAKERREEREKQHAAKESQILEKEKKARLQYEKQVEERQKKLEEQRQKEEQRRAAVEEKRKQKMEEEKEHYEAVIRRTMERSQRLEQRPKRWSWGGALSADSDSKAGVSRTTPSLPVGLVDKSSSSIQPQTADEGGSAADKRSASSTNLKQTDVVISKRLSSSSATLLSSPVKSAKRRSSSLNRLGSKASLPIQQPPQKVSQVEQKGPAVKKRSSSLNRLSSTPQPSPQLEKVTKEEHAASASAVAPQVHLSRGPMRSRSIDRQKAGPADSNSPSETKPLESLQKLEKEKRPPSPIPKRPPSPSNASVRQRSPSPANVAKRPPSPSAAKSSPKNRPPSPSMLRQRPPSPSTVFKPVPTPRLPTTPADVTNAKKKSEKESKLTGKTKGGGDEAECPQISDKEPAVATAAKTKEDPNTKMIAGTTTAEEASKILAEKRRLARENKEREEQEKIQQEEENRRKEEELARKAAEERAQKEEASRRLEEQRRLEDEEKEKKAEEERICKELEEQEKLVELQQQKEEAEAKALEEAEKQKQERERIMKQNLQERLERKKRIEEIMKRTRKGDQNDTKKEAMSAIQITEDGILEESNSDKVNEEEEFNGDDVYEESELQRSNSSEVTSVLSSPKPEEFEFSKAEEKETGINGIQQEIDQENNNGKPEDNVQLMDVSSALQENAHTSELVHITEFDKTDELVSKLNGKSSTWTFEEIIELGVHSKSTKLTVDGIPADDCNQNLIESAGIPESPIVAFEENVAMTCLTKTVEAASEI
ncbi:MAP7 domain-containing protein 2 isoform X10 [Latimeria chalumnae]|uniref:MAP7 domain-containing protein 2 isoform X10 n=1 Tax=Latimeria chalumnae TaxID=7897 RepID=UPI0003C114EB|nr:PREDICTED: MAP7 domain-containing protein 3 isoform X10 [Latimeria chalumnae]|eukprot:XP_005990412.1 PREDICTED: MAP7 domain-containing protein 3 isoform X10 [Latimeria chalumnae]